MIIGIPREIKQEENRVALTPSQVQRLVEEHHQVWVQKGAGEGSLIKDSDFQAAGAGLLSSLKQVYEKADLIVKVKEPLPREYPYLRPHQILYTFLHLAAEPKLSRVLMKSKVSAVAYETIQEAGGSLPLLKPMSIVAGRLATQIGATYLQKNRGGRGILLGGVPGVFRARTVIMGGGTVGKNAAAIALGLGSKVSILDIDTGRLEALDHHFKGRVQTLYSHRENVEKVVPGADLLIGAVLQAGGKAPRLISRDLVSSMQEGSVIVDVSIDQGGCVETIRPTSHKNPTFTYKGVLHYGVPNIPGIVARTSTYALTNATFPYLLAIANKGLKQALRDSPALTKGLNVFNGFLTHRQVARDLKLRYKPLPS